MKAELHKISTNESRVTFGASKIKIVKQHAENIRRHELSMLKLIALRYPQEAKKVFIEVLNEKLLTNAMD